MQTRAYLLINQESLYKLSPLSLEINIQTENVKGLEQENNFEFIAIDQMLLEDNAIAFYKSKKSSNLVGDDVLPNRNIALCQTNILYQYRYLMPQGLVDHVGMTQNNVSQGLTFYLQHGSLLEHHRGFHNNSDVWDCVVNGNGVFCQTNTMYQYKYSMPHGLVDQYFGMILNTISQRLTLIFDKGSIYCDIIEDLKII